MKEIEAIRTLLGEPLSVDNGNKLRDQLASCESWLPYVSEQLRTAQQQLADVRLAGLPEKAKGQTELDRETYQQSYSAKQKKQVDELKDIFAIIGQRISLGQTFLKSIQTEMEKV